MYPVSKCWHYFSCNYRKSESEEEEEDEEDSDSDSTKRHRKEEPEDAVGKIVIVEMNEKRKNSFFPALVSEHLFDSIGL